MTLLLLLLLVLLLSVMPQHHTRTSALHAAAAAAAAKRIVHRPNTMIRAVGGSATMTTTTTMRRRTTSRTIPCPSAAAALLLAVRRVVPVPAARASSSRCYYSHPSRVALATRSSSLFFSSSSSSSATTTTTTVTAASNVNDDKAENEERLYRELEWIATELRRHDDLYYNNSNNNPEMQPQQRITDDEYDALAEHEARLCREYPQLWRRYQRDSGLGPTATRYRGRVGSTSSTIPPKTNANTSSTRQRRQRHGQAMLSLDNVHDTVQLLAWLERVRQNLIRGGAVVVPTTITIVTEPKLDGLSLNLRYQRITTASGSTTSTPAPAATNTTTRAVTQYRLVWAATRGDGRQGQDVTASVQPMRTTIPNWIGVTNKDSSSMLPPDQLEVRGEVVLPQSVFEQWQQQQQQQGITNDDDQPIFANARNAASGILLRSKLDPVAERLATHPLNVTKNHGVDSNNNNTKNDIDSNITSSSSSSNDNERLRSALRFYAYQLVDVDAATSSTTTTTPLGLQNQEQVQTWLEEHGFVTPRPRVTTTLTLEPEHAWTESDIAPLLEYYEALREFRLQQQPQQQQSTASTTKQQPSSHNNNNKYQWDDYHVDGCVHKVSELHRQTQLGQSTRYPKWAVAHKFPSTTAVTPLWDVQVQVGRTGALTPVALLQAVSVAGVVVQRATLHNFAHMRHVLLGGTANHTSIDDDDNTLKDGTPMIRKGTYVMVRRAGDVIPQVVSRVSNPIDTEVTWSTANPESQNSTDYISLATPTRCPACGSPATFDDAVTERRSIQKDTSSSSSSIGQVLRCRGPPLNCPPRAVGAIRHAFVRETLEIKGLSEKRIEQLWEAGFLRRPSDLFVLVKDEAKLQQISNLDGWGTKSVNNLVAEAQRVATEGVSLARFIQSLGIRLVGSTASELLAASYGTATAFLDDLEKAADFDNQFSDQQMNGVAPFTCLEDKESEWNKGIGPVLMASLWDFASQKEMVQEARQLARCIGFLDNDATKGSARGNRNVVAENNILNTAQRTPLTGLSVAFAGTIPKLTQAEAKQTAKAMGARATPNTVSLSTGLVICGKNGGKKREQAERLGVRVMEADTFLELIEVFRSSQPEAFATDESTSISDLAVDNNDDDEGGISAPSSPPKPLAGLTVVITGSLTGLTRSEANSLAKELGARSTPSSVSKSTGLLVRGEKAGPKKIAQADNLGIRMIDGKEFLEMVETFRSGDVE